MKTWIVCVCFGVMAVSYFPELPGLPFIVLLFLCLLISLRFQSLRLLGAVVFGLLWGMVYGWLSLDDQLLVKHEGKDLWVTGHVVGVPRQYRRYQRFDFLVSGFENDSEEALNLSLKKIRINWYQVKNLVKPNDYWRLQVRLKKPHGFANPGGFNYETWLFRQGIGATGYVRFYKQNTKLREKRASVIATMDGWRYSIISLLKDQLEGHPNKGLLLALSLGEKNEITPAQWQLLSATGTNHLFVISGLHVGFVALCAYFIGLFVGRIFLFGAPRWSVQQTATCFALVAALIYAFLAGFSLPTQRALIMLSVMLFGQLIKQEVNVWGSYCIALLLVLLNDPLAAEAKGFWLSFIAVAALIYGFQGRTQVRKISWRWFRPQWVVFVALLPVLLVSFQQFSLVSPIANTVAVPVVGFLLVPMCLLVLIFLGVFPSLAEHLLMLIAWVLESLLSFLYALESFSFSIWIINPSNLAVVISVVGIFILLSPKGLPGRWLAGLCLLPLFVESNSSKTIGEFSVTVLDVGQGLSAVVTTKDHYLVYDVGAKYSESFNAADAVILPFLKYKNITHLDRVVVSHSDNDHAGALPMLLNGMSVGDVITGTPLKHLTVSLQSECKSGYSWSWDGVSFQLMQAEPTAWKNENNRSCVLKVSSGEHSVLLAGDIEEEGEKSLVYQFSNQLRTNVLVVPHHGSLTSSTQAFIEQVSPDYAVFTTGYKNHFGHPHKRVVNRYQKHGAVILNTVSSGAITFIFHNDKTVPIVKEYRRIFKRYWY